MSDEDEDKGANWVDYLIMSLIFGPVIIILILELIFDK
jgi:hypothetical protein